MGIARLILGKHKHIHICGCGNELHCRQADCAAGQQWQCPRCDQQMQDDYFSQLSARIEADVRRDELDHD